MTRAKVLLFNPQSEFYAMPLGLLAVGSALNPERYDVRIFDARIQADAAKAVIGEAEDAVCVGMTVFSGPSIGDAQRLSQAIKRMYPCIAGDLGRLASVDSAGTMHCQRCGGRRRDCPGRTDLS